MRTIALVAMLLVGGCAELARQEMAAKDGQCRSYGYQPGTGGYANCRMALDFQQQQASAQAARNAAAAIAQGSAAQAQAYQGFPQWRPVTMVPPQVTCNTTYNPYAPNSQTICR